MPGPAAIGAIAGATIPLGLALAHLWQLGVLALAAVWLLGLRRGVVTGIVGAGALGVIAVLAGALPGARTGIVGSRWGTIPVCTASVSSCTRSAIPRRR